MLTSVAGSAGLLTNEPEYLLRRFTESAATTTGRLVTTEGFHDWFAELAGVHACVVNRVPLSDLDGWRRDDGTGNLVHGSGRFFSIEGLAVATDHRERDEWTQPIIVQPEIGILGILVKEFGGVLHFLMQAKVEPGNINTLQLSPTVQATRSNYSRVHNGSPVPYLEYFVTPRRGRVLVDSLQSEQGAWFLHKRNRNMVVEVTDDVPLRENFCWLTLGQLWQLLLVDNLVNMDSRTVLAGIPFAAPVDRPSVAREDSFRGGLLRSLSQEDGALHDMAGVLSWFTEVKTRHTLAQRRVPLFAVRDWHSADDGIRHDSGKYFEVIGVEVAASSREVASWSQPMLAPRARGVLAFLTKRVGGVLHVLVQARTEAGTFDVVEMAPTVHCTPNNYAGTGVRPPPYLDYVLSVDPSRIRRDVVHAEEGGRLYHAENRYVVIEVEDDFPLETPDDFLWLTMRQVNDLVKYGNYFNIEARSLLVCLHTLW